MGGVVKWVGKTLGLGGGDNGASKAAAQQMKLQEEQLGLQREELEKTKAEQEKLRLAQEEQQREKAKQDAAASSARRRRGGSRALLSDVRLNPETGLEDETFGVATKL